ncbi:MAG TPA: hypothetical protein VGK41_01285 [Solirubrobacterales bacterium]
MYASLPVPNATRSDPATYAAEVAALTRLLRDQCPGPAGERPTMQQIGDLLGVSDSLLYAYASPPKVKRRRRPALPPYTLIYALRALAAYLPGARRALWPGLPGAPDGAG